MFSSFLKACDEDVLKLMCGKTRVGAVEGAKHLQGLTIDLSQKPDSVSPACRKEMETITENGDAGRRLPPRPRAAAGV